MTHDQEMELWRRLVALVRRYAAEKYGLHAVGLGIHMLGEQNRHYEPIPRTDWEEAKPAGGQPAPEK